MVGFLLYTAVLLYAEPKNSFQDKLLHVDSRCSKPNNERHFADRFIKDPRERAVNFGCNASHGFVVIVTKAFMVILGGMVLLLIDVYNY